MSKFAEKESQEFREKVLHINRCAKVTTGGRKFSFSALVLIADSSNKLAYGFAKANELTDAIRKAGDDAKKHLRSYPMRGTSIPHEVTVHFDGATIFMKPAPKGSGVVAGSKPRMIVEMAGYEDIVIKSLGSSNPMNQVKATFKALSQLKSVESLNALRGG
jgi:small subunit ribosomal protein S5